MMWERAVEHIKRQGGQVLMGLEVVRIDHDAARGKWSITARSPTGATERFSANHIVCSMPIRELARNLTPPMSVAARDAAERLKYRDFLVITLVVKDRDLFDDNWIYIHEPGVKVGRIQNFKSWSPEMIPEPTLNCYGIGFFASRATVYGIRQTSI